MNEFDRTHIGELVAGHGTWFTAHLLRLIAKADAKNLANLRLAFPEEVQAFIEWQEGRAA